MRKIYKKRLTVQEKQIVLFKGTDRVIKVEEQSGFLSLWYITDDVSDEPFYELIIYIIGTGHTLGDAVDADYVNTVVMQNGLVWHVFMHERNT